MTDHVTQQELDTVWDFGDPGASETRLRTRIDAAAPGSIIRAELTTQLARAVGLQDRFDEADAILAGIDSADEVVRARVLLERGRLRNSAGDPDAAVPSFADALATAARAGHDFLAADAAHMLAIADPARAEHWTARGLEIVAAADGARTKRWAVGLHNNLGWKLFDQGDLDGALAEFERAADAARDFGTDDQRRWAQEAIDEVLAARSGRASLVIRAATPDDVGELTALKLASSRAPMAISDEERREFDGVLERWMRGLADSVVCRIAQIDGSVVGMAWMVLFERVPNVDQHRRLTGDIQSVYVQPEHRGAGIGARLIGSLCAEGDARGVARITVSSGSRAVPFYVRAGFEATASLLERRMPR